MRELEAAIEEIRLARDGIDEPDVRTSLDSIEASLAEMIDTAAGEQTNVDGALGDTQFDGAAPHADHLQEIEANLHEQEENAGRSDVERHLEAARKRIERVRSRREE